jgi:flagellar basal body-associated protein FliL
MNHIRFHIVLFGIVLLVQAGCGSESPEIDLHDPLRTLAMLEAQQQEHSAELYTEVDLGEFFVVKKQEDSPYGLGVSCHLYGVVSHKTNSEFEAIWALRQQRMRDSVIVLIQRAEPDMLVGSELELLRADLLKTCRQSLQSNLLQRVVISEFSVNQH